jgi:hypothetical protein
MAEYTGGIQAGQTAYEQALESAGMGYEQTLATGELGLTQATTDIGQQLQEDIYGFQEDWRREQRGTLNVLLGMDIWGEGGGDDTTTYGSPPGWPTPEAYNQWVEAGSDPNNAVNYGWQDPDPTDPNTGPTGGCFIAGTGIDTSDGIVPIEILEIGDIVKTYDLKDKKHGRSKITKTYKHEDIDGYIILNGIIKTTVYHPFYSDGKWIKAGELVIGDKILHVDGIEHSINSIDKIDDKVDVYNIEVDGTHNYFAEGYLVHNK